MALDTNPVFWRQWEQLGHAVVLQACRDYASARKKIEKKATDYTVGSDHYNPVIDIAIYEKFFRSKYFCYICPKFDGHELFDRLKDGGWKHIPSGHHHYTKKPVFVTKSECYYNRKLRNGGQHG